MSVCGKFRGDNLLVEKSSVLGGVRGGGCRDSVHEEHHEHAHPTNTTTAAGA